jgi:secreted trypsin-like serine protease
MSEFSHDIAVVKIQPVDLSVVPKLKLDSGQFSKKKTTVFAAGWGLTKPYRKSKSNNVLMEIEIPITDCGPVLQGINDLESKALDTSIMCAGVFDQLKPNWKNEDFKSIWTGDSGGPLLYMDDDIPVLVGIVSHVKSCLNDMPVLSMPGLFTKISDESVLDFILEHSEASSKSHYSLSRV